MEDQVPSHATYKTGEIVPISGIYRFVKVSDPNCEPTEKALEISVSKGEAFPPHQVCGAVEWELLEAA